MVRRFMILFMLIFNRVHALYGSITALQTMFKASTEVNACGYFLVLVG